MKKILGLAAMLLLAGLLFACGRAPDARTDTPSASVGAAALTSVLPREELTRISRADMTVLYYDESSSSVCVYDAGAKHLWRALPETPDGEEHAMLRVRARVGKTVYTLSSQTDSAANGGAAATVENGALHLTFDFLKDIDSKTRLHLTVPMTFTAQDGCMRVEVDCAALKAPDCSRNVSVLSLEVLPSFGAASESESNDFLFVPDGCGAIIHTNTPAPLALALPVYGKETDPQGARACVAAFGIKRGDAAFVALAQIGDALATVNAARPGKSEACSTAGVCFAVTPAEDGKESARAAKNAYTGTLTLAYRFLSEASADPAGMAAACRELLVRGGTLDLAPKRDERAAVPLHLTLVCTASFAVPGQGDFVSRHTVTTLAQAQDVLSLLRSKGVAEIDAVLRGALRGEGKSGNLRFLPGVARKTAAADFAAFAKSQNAAVSPSICALTAAPSARGQTRLQTLAGTLVTAETAVKPIGKSTKTERLLRSVRALPFGALALNDVGVLLCAGKTENRETRKAQVQQQLSQLFASKKLTVDGGNLYALKYAAAVTNLPNRTFFSADGYDAVPFLQMLLHGYTDYSGAPLNLADDAETAFLKAAEYGEAPAIACYFNDYGSADAPDNCNYQQAASRVQFFYERLNAALSGLGGKRITAHEEVKKGVFATTFGNSTTLYVNYNTAETTVHGVTVEGRGILRIN